MKPAEFILLRSKEVKQDYQAENAEVENAEELEHQMLACDVFSGGIRSEDRILNERPEHDHNDHRPNCDEEEPTLQQFDQFFRQAVPFFGTPDVIGTVTGLINNLGSQGIVGLVAVWVLYSIWKSRK